MFQRLILYRLSVRHFSGFISSFLCPNIFLHFENVTKKFAIFGKNLRVQIRASSDVILVEKYCIQVAIFFFFFVSLMGHF